MKLWRIDADGVSPQETEGDGYPGSDREGVSIFENTHFQSEPEAWAALRESREAHVRMMGRDVTQARRQLLKRESEAAHAAELFAAFCENASNRTRSL